MGPRPRHTGLKIFVGLLSVLIIGVALAAVFDGGNPANGPKVITNAPSTSAVSSPAAAYAEDIARAGGQPATSAQVEAIQAETSLICSLFTSGLPMDSQTSGPGAGLPTAVMVAALNDSKLCGPGVTISVPPTTWATP
jgi:hypothetical protein